ncbi:histidine kinase [Luteibacter sp. 1214]|uniref:hybrid sensor histidine kinase/response regulator n=1 Tax=Luteibacter sp. 1214 TaxID=2817735 RepID=UPI002860ECA0|nr:PAS-domain containing protein [Luteibacter sp. 1214]MDR6643390.1 histidine kinase [Luteibacter sp. 1214]
MPRSRLARLVTLLILLLAMAGSVALGGWWAWRRALGGIAAQSADRLNLHALAVQRLIDRFTVLPDVLALDPELRAALSGPTASIDTPALNRKLEQANGAVHASTLTLLDRDGHAVAANNWNTPESNVGLDYRFRPYFQDAMRDGHSTFYALGVSTNVPGYFITRTVDDDTGRHIGVVVVKITLDDVRHDWAREEDIVLLADRHGVVFLANRGPEWMYRALHALDPRDALSIDRTRQYGGRTLPLIVRTRVGTAGDGADQVRVSSPELPHEVIWRSLPLPQQAWTLHLLADARPATVAARNAALIVLAGWLPVILFGLFLQQRIRLARLRLRSREELERMVAHHAAALRSAQDSIVAAAHEATQGVHGNLEHLPQGVSVVDASLRLVAWNSRYQQIFGFPDDYMRVGRPIEDMFRFNARRGLLGPGDPEEAIQRRLAYLRAGSPHMYERERPDGTTFEIRGNPLPDGGFVTSYADITAYKAAARELRSLATSLEQRVDERTRDLHEAKAEAERANRSKTRFIAAAVHDLLQPLNAARLFIGTLAEGRLDANERELAERVRSALDTQDELLASLLDVSRLEGGAVEPRFTAVALGPMLADLARQFAVLADSRGLRLRWVDSVFVVRADALLLRRVLQNFLSNAIHYTPRGGVLIGARRQGDAVRIEVWDTGLGIPEAKTRAIFDEFLRLDNGVDRDRRSSGLGLSIVDRIGRLLGARVGVRSLPGRGSVFSIAVPVYRGDADAVAPGASAEDESPFTGARVMLVDADAVTRQATARLLSSWGCDVVAVPGASAAMRHAETDEAPSIVLLEDPIDGMATEELRVALGSRWGSLPPVVLIAEAPSASDVERAAAAGLRYLTKPLAPARLRAVMSRLLMLAG